MTGSVLRVLPSGAVHSPGRGHEVGGSAVRFGVNCCTGSLLVLELNRMSVSFRRFFERIVLDA